MRPWAFAAALFGALILAPTGQAALNGDHDFAVELPYRADLATDYTGEITVLSGSLAATVAPTSDPMLFFNVTQGGITGLTKVCWNAPLPDCRESASGGISVSWQAGSSVGLKFPSPVSGSATAAHALVFFVDMKQTINFGGVDLTFGRMMGAGTVGGEFAFDAIPAIPDTLIQDLGNNNAAGVVALDDQTVLTVTGSGSPVRFTQAHDAMTFQGKPVIAALEAEGWVVPFSAGGLTMGKADSAAAAQGIDMARVAGMENRIRVATGDQDAGFPTGSINAVLEQLQGLEVPLMNGALLTTMTNEDDVAVIVRGLTLIRFDSLTATGGETVAASGTGPLHIQGGRVQNAPELFGFSMFQLPWWSYALWALAIAAFVTRLVLGSEKAPKQNERWDRLKWIGWVAGPVAFLIFFLLWDNEVHSVLGVSLLSGANGAALLKVLALELLPMGIVFFAVVTPLRILLKNGLRIGKQGNFMGLSGPTATLLGFLIGATLLLSYFDVVLRQF